MLKRKLLLGIGIAGLLMLFSSLLAAQSSETILTISVDEWQMDMITDRVLEGFYETHPGVKIVTVARSNDENSYYGLNTSDIADSLDRAEAHFSSADVLVVSQYSMNSLITHAKYVLDLTPYIRADGSGDIDDFYPVALKTFAWDNGLWALPAALRVNFISYNPKAFDEAEYPYPDSSWGLSDYLDAGRALTVRDSNGVVTLPGFFGFEDRTLIGAFLGRPFYDASTNPETPVLSDPDIAAMVDALGLYNEELLGEEPDYSITQGWDWSKMPMQMGGSWLLSEDNPEPHNLVLFPNDTTIVSGEGFAISAGTQNPDLAYELVMYLTGNIEVVSRFFGDAPARRSLEGQTAENFGMPPVPPALAEILPDALENGIPASEMRYGEYIYLAHSKMDEDPTLTIEEALQQAQEQAVADIELAEQRQETTVLSVATPVPTPILSADEVALKFMLQSSFMPLPNRDAWDQVVQEFVDADPQVGHIELMTNSRGPDDYEVVDCAYTPYNSVAWIDLSLIQPLEPFLSTDSNFDTSDIPEKLWPAVTRDEMVYGLPITITPLMMWYNPNTFENAGAFPPQNGWMASDFIDALKVLKESQPGSTPYSSQNYSNTFYVLMAASLGGVAVDYTTYMPTYHLADPAVVEALRQTLDLAKDGYITYNELGGEQTFFGGGSQTALYDSSGGVYSWDDIGTDWNPYVPVTFPRGTDSIPLSFNVGAAFIMSHTPYADACYRWISTIAQRPDLFNEMPARRSHATDPDLVATRGQTAADFYTTLFDMMDSPESVFVPSAAFGSSNSSTGAYIAEIWFNQAMDAYVLEDRDLETALADAQTRIDEYSACIADFPPYDTSLGYEDGQWEAYYKQFTDCAVSVDPALAPRFEPQEE